MVGFYVMMLAVLALSAAAGYTIFASASTGSALSLAHQNSARIDQNMSALNFVVAVNAQGNFAVPLGNTEIPSDSTSRMILPDWVSNSATTPWGVSYSYCPYAPADWPGPPGVATNIHDSAGLSHTVSVSDEIVSHGTPRAYVTSGAVRSAHASDAAGAPDVLAFLISPSNNRVEVPACKDVYWTGHGWAVDGSVTGSVRALTPDALTHSLSEAPRLLHRYVSPTGTGTGETDSSPTSLEMALAEWAHLAPSRMTIKLSGGVNNHEVDLSMADLGSGPGNVVPNATSQGRSLHLVGESTTVIAASAGSGVLAVPVDMTISGVDFASSVGLDLGPGVRLVLRDGTSVPSVRSRGGHVVMSSGATIKAQGSGAPVVLEGGSMTIQGNASIDATGAGAGAVHLGGAGFRLDGSLNVDTDSGHDMFTDESHGLPSYGPTAQLTLSGDGDLSDWPDLLASNIITKNLDIGLHTQKEDCGNGISSCVATCPDDTRVVSGNCTADGTNFFLTGAEATDSDTSFTCTWSEVQGAGLTPSSLLGPTATALCAPIK